MEPISLKKIGEVAALLGTTPRALRFYEEEGLVSARRTSGGTRLYADNDIARFRAILHLAHSGIPLGLIKELATAREKYTTGAESSHSVHKVLDSLVFQVKEQIKTLKQLELDLSFSASTIEGCFQCANPPTRRGCPQCPVNQQLQSSELLNLIWEQSFEQAIA